MQCTSQVQSKYLFTPIYIGFHLIVFVLVEENQISSANEEAANRLKINVLCNIVAYTNKSIISYFCVLIIHVLLPLMPIRLRPRSMNAFTKILYYKSPTHFFIYIHERILRDLYIISSVVEIDKSVWFGLICTNRHVLQLQSPPVIHAEHSYLFVFVFGDFSS